MESFDVNSILENGKIKSKDWKRLSVGQRRYVMDQIDDEIYDMDILDLIAPKLRKGELPPSHAKLGVMHELIKTLKYC